MRLLAVVAVLAIVYYLYSQRMGGKSDSVNSAMDEYAKTVPAATQPAPGKQSTASKPAAPAPQSSGIRRPIDTTRNVLEQVKKRNGDGDF